MVLLDYSLATMLKQLFKEKKMQIILRESHFAPKLFPKKFIYSVKATKIWRILQILFEIIC